MIWLLAGAVAILAGCASYARQNDPATAANAQKTVDEANKELPAWVKEPKKDGYVVGQSSCYVENQIPLEHGATADWFKAHMRRFAKEDAINKACKGANASDDQNASAHTLGVDPLEYVGLCTTGGEVGNLMYLGYRPADIRCTNGSSASEYLRQDR